jgi:hypothetical protein
MAEDFLDAPWRRCLHKPAKPCEACLAVVLCSHCMRLHKGYVRDSCLSHAWHKHE